MAPRTKPVPKSSKLKNSGASRARSSSRSNSDDINFALGDTDTSESDADYNSAFRTPSPDSAVTDYGLEFTTNGIENANPMRCSTLNNETPATRRSTERRSQRLTTSASVRNNLSPIGEGRESGQRSSSRRSLSETSARANINEEPSPFSRSRSTTALNAPRSTNRCTSPATTSRSASRSRPPATSSVRRSTSAQDLSEEAVIRKLERVTLSRQTQQQGSRRRKSQTTLHRDARLVNECVKLSEITKCLIPKLPFSRVVKDILNEVAPSTVPFKVSSEALEAIQYSAEHFITTRFEDAYLLTLHRGRKTLQVKDLQLLHIFKPTT